MTAVAASRRTRLWAVALIGVALLGVGSARAADPPDSGHVLAPDVVAAGVARGSLEQRFVPLAPCRIIDTRNAGGALTEASRTFSAYAPYTAQGGKAGGCGIPSTATALQLNLGAMPLSTTGWVTGWPVGSAQPNASLLNFTSAGPISNMVTLPVTAGSSSFVLRVSGSANLYADVAGYYTPALYAAIAPAGEVYAGIQSGLTSVKKQRTGEFLLTFERSVIGCATATADIKWPATNDVSADMTYNWGDPNALTVTVTNSAGALADTYFSIMVTC